MKRRFFSMLPTILLLGLLAALVTVRSVTSAQSIHSMAIEPGYLAQYSTDGENWYTLAGADSLPKTDSHVLYLRMYFQSGCPEGLDMSFYLNHLFFSMEVGGEQIVSYLPDEEGYFPVGDLCGCQWYTVRSPGITSEDLVTFTLVNPHSTSNWAAYRDFLNDMFFGDQYAVKTHLIPRWQGWRAAGIVLIAGGVALLGMALAAALSRVPLDRWLGRLSVVTLCAGVWLLFDTPDVQLWSDRIVRNTALVLTGRMGTAFGLSLCVCTAVGAEKRPWQKAAQISAAALGIGTGVLAFLVLCDVLTLCNTEPLWYSLWMLCGTVMLLCLAAALRQKFSIDTAALLLVLLACFADLLNAMWRWWPDNTATKVCLMFALLVEVARGIQGILNNYEAAKRTMQMERELQNSHIRIMLSQIQPHFLYNALTVIQSLCGSNPAAAENAVNEFADFLRGNMNVLTQDKPIPFLQELEHTKHYLTLEKLRFGDLLRVEFELGPTLFRLPTLSLQPLVENAIRHGIRGSGNGSGTVRIVTQETPTFYEVMVLDDGIGFDPASVPEDGTHVGITNVRRRIQMMCGGDLMIESAPGAGTHATLRVPKNAGVMDDAALNKRKGVSVQNHETV